MTNLSINVFEVSFTWIFNLDKMESSTLTFGSAFADFLVSSEDWDLILGLNAFKFVLIYIVITIFILLLDFTLSLFLLLSKLSF